MSTYYILSRNSRNFDRTCIKIYYFGAELHKGVMTASANIVSNSGNFLKTINLRPSITGKLQMSIYAGQRKK